MLRADIHGSTASSSAINLPGLKVGSFVSKFATSVTVLHSFGEVGSVKLTSRAGLSRQTGNSIYLSHIQVEVRSLDPTQIIVVPCHSWVSAEQGDRVFFTNKVLQSSDMLAVQLTWLPGHVLLPMAHKTRCNAVWICRNGKLMSKFVFLSAVE